jgi:hypothetical protein
MHLLVSSTRGAGSRFLFQCAAYAAKLLAPAPEVDAIGITGFADSWHSPFLSRMVTHAWCDRLFVDANCL